MTRVLSFDLAYSGETGWVVWDDERPYPVADYGSFHPKGKTDYKKVFSLYQVLSDMIYTWRNTRNPLIDYVCYEQTDWHRNINGKKGKVEYAIERKAQWSLGMANAIILLAASMHLPEDMIIAVGAMEAKREFGSATKKGVAELLAQEYQDKLGFNREAEKDCLVDLVTGLAIADHISDAMAIASVTCKRIRRDGLA